MAKRKSTSKRQRFNIFKRDQFTCQYCGRTPPSIVLVVDHVLPVAAGGGSEDTNLVTSCEACNQGKSDGLLTDVPKAIDAALIEQVERREQLEAYNEFLMESRNREEKLAREIGVYWNDRTHAEAERGQWTFGDERLLSTKTFLRRMPAAEIYDAIDIAFSRIRVYDNDNKAWKYFCGVCWSKIKKREGGDG